MPRTVGAQNAIRFDQFIVQPVSDGVGWQTTIDAVAGAATIVGGVVTGFDAKERVPKSFAITELPGLTAAERTTFRNLLAKIALGAYGSEFSGTLSRMQAYLIEQ